MVENRISTVQWQLLLKQWGKEVQDGGKVLGTGDDKVVMPVTPPHHHDPSFFTTGLNAAKFVS